MLSTHCEKNELHTLILDPTTPTQSHRVTESQSHRVTESQSHRVTESQSHRVTESQSHRVRRFIKLDDQVQEKRRGSSHLQTQIAKTPVDKMWHKFYLLFLLI